MGRWATTVQRGLKATCFAIAHNTVFCGASIEEFLRVRCDGSVYIAICWNWSLWVKDAFNLKFFYPSLEGHTCFSNDAGSCVCFFSPSSPLAVYLYYSRRGDVFPLSLDGHFSLLNVLIKVIDSVSRTSNLRNTKQRKKNLQTVRS